MFAAVCEECSCSCQLCREHLYSLRWVLSSVPLSLLELCMSLLTRCAEQGAYIYIYIYTCMYMYIHKMFIYIYIYIYIYFDIYNYHTCMYVYIQSQHIICMYVCFYLLLLSDRTHASYLRLKSSRPLTSLALQRREMSKNQGIHLFADYDFDGKPSQPDYGPGFTVHNERDNRFYPTRDCHFTAGGGYEGLDMSTHTLLWLK